MIALISLLLHRLGISYNREFLKHSIEEQPYSGTLWAVQNVLKLFGVSSEGLLVDTEELPNIPVPFVANTHEGMVVVTRNSGHQVEYATSQSSSKTISADDFRQLWIGQVLLPQSNPSLGEFKYKEHLNQGRNKRLNSFVRYATWCICLALLLVCLTWKCHTAYTYWPLGFAGLFVIGIVLSILLLQEQVFNGNAITHKLCGSVKNGNCSSVVHSDAAKVIGGYSWSEIGFSYYATGLLCLTFSPDMMGVLSILSIAALPYPVWSIWYQKFKLRKWCVLCVLVQLVLVLAAGYAICCNHFECTIPQLALYGMTYALTLTVTNYIANLTIRSGQSRLWEKVYKQLKFSNGVYEAISANEQTITNAPSLESSLVFGNRDADCHITVFSNLHCVTCAKLHEVLKWVNRENCYITYYFTSLTPQYVHSAKQIIACYQQHGEAVTGEVLNAWYDEVGKGLSPSPLHISLDINTPEVDAEQKLHENWMRQNKLMPTPIVFINGRKLPPYYTLDELINLLP